MSAPSQYELSPGQQETLARLSAQTGRPWAEVLERALASYAQHIAADVRSSEETVQAALVRLGLLGCLKAGPPDLSTNPQYLEGFGAE